jgi:hypothetical protein
MNSMPNNVVPKSETDLALQMTNKLISELPRKQAVALVHRIVSQLNSAHGDSYGDKDGFEFATLYFP